MKTLSYFVAVLFVIISCNNPKNKRQVTYIQIDTIDVYPVYHDCSETADNETRLDCLWNNLAFFYNFHLGNVYKDRIKNINDTIKLNLKIDTLGYLKLEKIDYKNQENKMVLDSIIKSITSIVPKIKPAEYQGKKVNFKFKLPIIFSSEHFENE